MLENCEGKRVLILSLPLTIQRPTLFATIMDAAGVNHTGNNHHQGSRTNSLEPPGAAGHETKEHPVGHHGHRGSKDHDHDGAFEILAAAEQRRHRSIRNKKMDLQDVPIGDSRAGSLESLQGDQRLHPHHTAHPPRHSRSPSLRSPSPRQRYDHRYQDGLGFSDTVNNVVEIQRHHTQGSHPYHGYRGRLRDYYDHCDYYDDGPWSASTSPARSPSPVHRMDYLDHPRHRYGTTSLDQRSRSPSPMTARSRAPPQPPHYFHQQASQHSYPVLMTRRIGPVRRLPPTPNKPSSLQLKAPSNINFPRLNASPTHGPLSAAAAVQAAGSLLGPVAANGLASQALAVGPPACPLSFEQAMAMGRGSRMLPSPVPNGYKPQAKQRAPRSRHSDSDDDDWC